VAISTTGSYRAPSGREVSIADSVRAAIEGGTLITPGTANSLQSRAVKLTAERAFQTEFAVNNETTLSAARRLCKTHGPDRTAALNFASAKNPGGGFLGGSQAQEESLARASALYLCLSRHMPYYDANRRSSSSLYTDHMVVSPLVPVFRDDSDQLLEVPYEVTFITSPAPNAKALADNHPHLLDNLEPTLRRRMSHVLSAAVVHGQTALVLGAWGCGVFGNDPGMVSNLFGEMLLGQGAFSHAFERVEFAVLDRKGDTIAAFENVFGQNDLVGTDLWGRPTHPRINPRPPAQ